MKHHKPGITALFAVVGAVFVTGCGAGGGSTTCGEFADMSQENQQETVENMIAERGQDGSNSNLMVTMGSVRFYCFVHSDGSRIDGIYTG